MRKSAPDLLWEPMQNSGSIALLKADPTIPVPYSGLLCSHVVVKEDHGRLNGIQERSRKLSIGVSPASL